MSERDIVVPAVAVVLAERAIRRAEQYVRSDRPCLHPLGHYVSLKVLTEEALWLAQERGFSKRLALDLVELETRFEAEYQPEERRAVLLRALESMFAEAAVVRALVYHERRLDLSGGVQILDLSEQVAGTVDLGQFFDLARDRGPDSLWLDGDPMRPPGGPLISPAAPNVVIERVDAFSLDGDPTRTPDGPLPRLPKD